MTYHGRIKNGQITLDAPITLPEGAEVAVRLIEKVNSSKLDRRQILRLPLDERRELLREQSQRLAEHYEGEPDRSEWQGGDIIE